MTRHPPQPGARDTGGAEPAPGPDSAADPEHRQASSPRPSSPRPSPRPSPWRRWGKRLAKLTLLILALWLSARLLAGLDWHDLAARMEEASPAWLTAAVVALMVRFVVWDERWRRALARLGGAPPRSITLPSLLSAATVNTVTPTARILGGVMRARHLSRAGQESGGEPESMGRAYGSVLYDQIAHQGVIGALTWISLIAAAALAGRPNLAWWLGGALAVTALALAVALRSGGGGGGRGDGSGLVGWLAERVAGPAADDAAGEGGEEGKLRRLVTHGREAVRVVRRLLRDRRLAAEAILLTLVFFIVNASAQWMVFEALGSEVSFLVVVAVVALGAMAGVAVGTPGGIGGAEAAMIATFTAFGVGRLDAAAGALLYRAFHFATILALGVPSLLWLEVRLGRKRETQEETQEEIQKEE